LSTIAASPVLLLSYLREWKKCIEPRGMRERRKKGKKLEIMKKMETP
jgi:hypothetical protein